MESFKIVAAKIAEQTTRHKGKDVNNIRLLVDEKISVGQEYALGLPTADQMEFRRSYAKRTNERTKTLPGMSSL
jgi:hypothetical protein